MDFFREDLLQNFNYGGRNFYFSQICVWYSYDFMPLTIFISKTGSLS